MSSLLTVVCAHCGKSAAVCAASAIAARRESAPDVMRAALVVAVEQAAALCDARAASEEITADRVSGEPTAQGRRYERWLEACARAQTARELADAIRSMK